MADWLTESTGRMASAGFSAPQTGTVVTANASANVKGVYAPLIASTTVDTYAILLACSARSAAAADYLVDIAVGASAAEIVVIPNILFSAGSTSGDKRCLYFPLSVRKGTRISARCQSSTASATITIGLWSMDSTWGNMPSFDSFIAQGALTATSGGTVLSNPAAAGFGAWTSLGTTPNALGWVLPVLGDNKVATRTAAQLWFYDCGMGATGSEQQIHPDVYFTSTSTTFSISHYGPGCYWRVPVSTQINGRYGASAALTLGATIVVYGGVI